MCARSTLVLLAALAGCTVFVPHTGEPSTKTFEVPAPRDAVFEAALVVAQDMNLNVSVLEKSSGFLRLEDALVGPASMDKYCEYFEVDEETGEPYSTFSRMGIVGSVSMTILFAASSEQSTSVDLRANWRTLNGRVATLLFAEDIGPIDLQSKKVLEGEFESRLLATLGKTRS